MPRIEAASAVGNKDALLLLKVPPQFRLRIMSLLVQRRLRVGHLETVRGVSQVAVPRHLGEGATEKPPLQEEAGVAERQADRTWKLVEITSPQGPRRRP